MITPLPQAAACLALVAGLWLAAVCVHGGRDSAPAGAQATHQPIVHQVEIEVSPTAMEGLRKAPRRRVPARVVFDGVPSVTSSVHLKGSLGSFQPVDARPSLTIACAGLGPRGSDPAAKFHLNNSAEDPSLLSEQLGAEIFRAAGVPSPEVSHARVRLNGRDLGLYVLVGATDAAFLARSFGSAGGCVFDHDWGVDVDQTLKPHGPGPAAPGVAAMARLAAGVSREEQPPSDEFLSECLDLETFVSFMATEVLIGHRDGYCLARNNFLIHAAKDTGRLTFLPHGMDQLFGPPDLTWRPQMAGVAARAVTASSEGRSRYERRFRELFDQVYGQDRLARRVDELESALAPFVSSSERAVMRDGARALRARVSERGEALRRQLATPEPQEGPASGEGERVAFWTLQAGPEKLPPPAAEDSGPLLHLAAEGRASAAWQACARLEPGRYRFESQVRTLGVTPLGFGRHHGAAIRVEGLEARSAAALGTASWRPLAVEFEVPSPGADVRLLCELRAKAGDAWFNRDQMLLRRLN